MIRLVQNNLIIPRGDTGTFSVPVLSSLGESIGVFTIIDLKTNTKILEKQVTPSGETLTIEFLHGDTVNLPAGKYAWDIKFYLNPIIADGKLIDGTEVNSYYAAYRLPYCEIRQTGDNLLTSDDSPKSTITPQSLNALEAVANEVVIAKQNAVEAAENAAASALEAQGYAAQVTGLTATAETLESDQSATASYDSTTGTLTIGIPKGEIPNFSIGEITEGATADATITGTTSNPILNLTLPNANVQPKADKVINAVSGNFAGLDENGNLTDSGHKHSDYVTQETDPTVPAWAKAENKPSYTAVEVGALPSNTFIPTKVSDLTDDSGHYTKPIDGIPSTDLASAITDEIAGKATKVANATSGNFAALDSNGNLIDSGHKHSDYLTEHQDITGKADKVVNAINNNFAGLDSNGNLIDSGHKHSDYITAHQDISGKADKVVSAVNGNFAALDNNGNLIDSGHKHSDYLISTLKGANNGLAELDASGKVPSSQLPSYVDDILEYDDIARFPQTGETGKIYVAKDTNLTYRWSGSEYIEISASLALGETSSTAYRGDYGAAAYAHAVTNKGSAYGNGLYKITTNSEGHITAANIVEKNDITALGIPAQDTTYESKTAASGGTDISLVTTGEKYNWNNKYDKPINGIPASDLAEGTIPDTTIYATKADTVLTSTLSRGRASGSTVGQVSFAFGEDVTASGIRSHAEGSNTHAIGNDSHAEGYSSAAEGSYTHAEGVSTLAKGNASHAEGLNTVANGSNAHAEGVYTIANGNASHAGGWFNVADTYDSWNEWVANTEYNIGDKVKITNENTVKGYICTIANSDASFTSSKWSLDSQMNYIESIGNGTANNARSNARTLDWEGNEWLKGDLYVGANANGTGGSKVAKVSEIPDITGKADKVNSAIEGNFAALDSNGNLTDSGHKHSDYLTEHQSLTGKQDKITASGLLKGDGNGGVSSAVAGTDYIASHQDISGKADKVSDGTSGNFAALDANGNLTDSGHKHSDYLTEHQSLAGKQDKITASGLLKGDGTGGITAAVSGTDYGTYSKPSGGIPASDLASGVIPSVPVQDVQVNGASVLNNGVANVPIASASKAGVIKIDEYGLKINTSVDVGTLAIIKAADVNIKSANANYTPIVPSNQHTSVFYGLAKAAGDSTQSSSSNAVGTYTENAKDAIQQMLGVDSLIAIHDTSTATAAHAIGEIFIMNSKLYRATAAIAINDTITVGTNCEAVKIADVFTRDVRVNGSSVISNGVANIPAASTSTYGAVKIGTGLIIESGKIVIDCAIGSIKLGTGNYYPIVPSHQHESVFYGLAKAAGDSTQSSSNNAVGTYTDAAKTAIRNMIGAIGSAEINEKEVVINAITTNLNAKANMVIPSTNGNYATLNTQGDLVDSGYKANGIAFYGLAAAAGDSTQSSSNNAVGTYTSSAKSAIQTMLGIENGVTFVETVSGTTPSITGEPNTIYECGEVSTLTIAPPAVGTIDVTFTSGSTATVLTITPPSGVTAVKWPTWFDATALEANTIYELVITNGVRGGVMTWES